MLLERPLWSAGKGLRPPLSWHARQLSRPSNVCGMVGTTGGCKVPVGVGTGVAVAAGLWQAVQVFIGRPAWSCGNGTAPEGLWHKRQFSRPSSECGTPGMADGGGVGSGLGAGR